MTGLRIFPSLRFAERSRSHFFALWLVGVATLAATFSSAPAFGDAAGADHPPQCHLFPDGVQELNVRDLKVSNLRSILLSCREPVHGNEMIAIRRFRIVGGEAHLLLVDPTSLITRIERESCLKCESTSLTKLQNTRYGQAVARLAKDYTTVKGKGFLTAAGLKTSENDYPGTVVTADLCPTRHAFEKGFFEDLKGLQKETPVALATSGLWLLKHKTEFDWLKSQVRDGRLAITWVNHSFHHPYNPDKPEEQNFMLRQGVNIQQEILETERVLIENGVTPSPFFRFPGLVSDRTLMRAVRTYHLIPLAADAWLNKGQLPKDHSIILVHANGNEHAGIVRFHKLAQEKHLPLPVLPVQVAPKVVDKPSTERQ